MKDERRLAAMLMADLAAELTEEADAELSSESPDWDKIEAYSKEAASLFVTESDIEDGKDALLAALHAEEEKPRIHAVKWGNLAAVAAIAGIAVMCVPAAIKMRKAIPRDPVPETTATTTVTTQTEPTGTEPPVTGTEPAVTGTPTSTEPADETGTSVTTKTVTPQSSTETSPGEGTGTASSGKTTESTKETTASTKKTSSTERETTANGQEDHHVDPTPLTTASETTAAYTTFAYTQTTTGQMLPEESSCTWYGETSTCAAETQETWGTCTTTEMYEEPVSLLFLDEETGKPVRGAVVRIYDVRGTLIAEYRTDGSPIETELDNYTSYRLHVVSVPDGYRLPVRDLVFYAASGENKFYFRKT